MVQEYMLSSDSGMCAVDAPEEDGEMGRESR